MTEHEILGEVKKGIDLFLEGTYNMDNLYSHFMQIIRDNDKANMHKAQLERMMFLVEKLLNDQAQVWSGHKNMIPTCKTQEKELFAKIQNLKKSGVYSLERFYKEKPQQGTLL